MAGTSIGTVSTVLNGRNTAIRVSDPTRQRIWAVARQMGFYPNAAARCLRTGRSYSLGVVVTSTNFGYERLRYADQAASRHGYRLVLMASQWSLANEQEAIHQLASQRVDGIMLFSPVIDSGKRTMLARVQEMGIPVVAVGVLNEPGVDRVDWDRRGAYRSIAEHLLDRGCRRFIFPHSISSPATLERLDGIRLALKAAPAAELKIVTPPQDQSADSESTDDALDAQLAIELESGWPQAIICPTDIAAARAMRLAQAAGRNVPGNLAITGCSDTNFAPWLSTPLTSVRMPEAELGRIPIDMLLERIEETDAGARGEDRIKLLDAPIIWRESSRFGNGASAANAVESARTRRTN